MKFTKLLFKGLLSPDAPDASERHNCTRNNENDKNAPTEWLTGGQTYRRVELRRASRQVDRNAQAHQKSCVDDAPPIFASGALPVS